MKGSFGKIRLGLMGKVFGASMLGLLITVGLMAAVTIHLIDRDIQQNAEDQLNLAIALELTLLDEKMEAAMLQAAAISRSEELFQAIDQKNTARATSILYNYKQGADNLHILTAVGRDGLVVGRANSSQSGQPFRLDGLVERALQGETVRSAVLISPEEWGPEGDSVRNQIAMAILETAGATRRDEVEVTEALALVGVAPVKDSAGRVAGAVIAAEILNNNHAIVDQVSTATDGVVTATIALDGVRVTTNVQRTNEHGERERATGTIYSDPVMAKLRAGEEYRGTAQVVGQTQRVIYVPLEDHNGKVIAGPFVGIPQERFLVLRNAFLMSLAPFVALGLAVAGLLCFLVTRLVIRSLRQVQQQLDEITAGGGDLTREIRVASQDEVGALVYSFNGFLGTLRSMVRSLRESADQVTHSATDLADASDQTASASQETARAIGTVAAGANHQAGQAGDVQLAVDKLQEQINQIAKAARTASSEVVAAESELKAVAEAMAAMNETARQVAASSLEAAQTATDGTRAVDLTVQRMERIQRAVGATATEIQSLTGQATQIGDITRVISEIAEQTNLLALNAAIEAARAGEHGRGFAVVADEVRKLAERSAKSTAEIGNLIKAIQLRTDEAARAMEEGIREVEEGSALAQEAGRSLAAIRGTITRAAAEVQQIAEAAAGVDQNVRSVVQVVQGLAAGVQHNGASAEAMAASATQVISAVAEIASAATEAAAATEEVSATAEELTATAEQVSASAKELERVAEELHAQVGRFKV